MMIRNMRTCSMALVTLLCLAYAAYAEPLAGSGDSQSLTVEAAKGTWHAQLVRQGSDVTGNIDLDGSNVLSGGSVTGQIDGSGVTLGVMVDGAQLATFSGMLKDGAVSGEWQLTSDALKDQGVWSGTLQRTATSADTAN